MKDNMCNTCNGELERGQKCSDCGASRATYQENCDALASSQRAPFDIFAVRFRDSLEELTAMIDLRFRLNYPTPDKKRTMEFTGRIENGELPSKLVLET